MAEEEKIVTGDGEEIPSMDDFKEELEESFQKQKNAKRQDMASWEKVVADLEQKREFEIEISEVVKAGVTATVEGLRAFIPASQLSLTFVDEKDLPEWAGKKLMVRVITADPENNRLVLSAKAILKEEEAKLRAEKMENVKAGLITEGTVESLKDYGAFVKIDDGITGLLHVSQISQKRVKSPADVLKVGQIIRVKVTDVKDGRISLSMKALEADYDEKREHRERENFRENFRGDKAVTTSLGDLIKKLK